MPNASFSYMPIPVDFEELKINASNKFYDHDRPFALYLGVISKNKGVDKIISAFIRSLKFKSKAYQLILAGPLQEPDIIENLPDNISYIGKLERSKAIAAISSASLLLVTGGFEGMPRVAVEGIMLGTPVILPPGIKELEKLELKSIIKKVDIENLIEYFDMDWKSFEVDTLELSQFDLSQISIKNT